MALKLPTVADIKNELRFAGTDEDAKVEAMIEAAVEYVSLQSGVDIKALIADGNEYPDSLHRAVIMGVELLYDSPGEQSRGAHPFFKSEGLFHMIAANKRLI